MILDLQYKEWNHCRAKAIIARHGYRWFQGKRVLDLGAFHGDIGAALARLGSEVLCVDARQENIDFIKTHHPHLKTMMVDLDKEFPFNAEYDIVLSLGLLCHLRNYERHLSDIYKVAEHIILESEVCDSNNKELYIPIVEERITSDLSFHGKGSIPSAANVESLLSNLGAQFKRMDDRKLNSGVYKYDWTISNSQQRKPGNRRMWFIKHDLLLEKLANSNKAMKNGIRGYLPAPAYPDVNEPRPIVPMPEPFPMISVGSRGGAMKTISEEASNKKVAILISGHLRVFEKTAKALQKNVLSDIKNYDIFIHTWETLGARRSRGREHDNSVNNERTHNKLNEIMNAYNPKGLVIEKYVAQDQIKRHCASARLSLEEKRCFYGDDIFDYSAMLFSWQKVWNMMEEYERQINIKYDMIFKYRSDILFPDKLYILNNPILVRTIYIPIIAKYLNNGMNDQVAFGDRIGMEIYHNIYDRQIEYINKKATKPMVPETLLKHHLSCNTVSVRNIPINYFMLRSTGQLLVPKYDGFDVLPNQSKVAHLL